MQVSLGTLVMQGVTFFIFIYVTVQYVWPPIAKAMAERNAKIADGLAAAERGKSELEAASARAEQLIEEARGQAMEIVEQANRRASDIIEEARSDGERQRQRQLAAARAEIEQTISRTRDDLRAQVAGIAVAGAERILMREIDSETHRDILDKLAAEI